jgi:peptide/nickel transport system permease protein
MSELGLASAAEVAAPAARQARLPSLLVIAAVLVVAAVVVAALFGSWIAPYDPNHQDLLTGLSKPSSEHLLGTDDLGRDVLSRTIVGARTALVGPLLIALGAMLLGNALGLVAGYVGGAVDSTISRFADLVFALPALLVAIVVVGVVGGGYSVAVALLVLLYCPVDTRIVRGATLAQRRLPYVEAARMLGLSRRRIMFRHIWPNVLPLAVANAFLTFAFSLVSLAALSFLGLGAGPETPDWGRMLSDSRTLLFDNPWSAVAPGVALVLTAASINIIGDWLFERLSEGTRSR